MLNYDYEHVNDVFKMRLKLAEEMCTGLELNFIQNAQVM
jgi:hypothetical protein